MHELRPERNRQRLPPNKEPSKPLANCRPNWFAAWLSALFTTRPARSLNSLPVLFVSRRGLFAVSRSCSTFCCPGTQHLVGRLPIEGLVVATPKTGARDKCRAFGLAQRTNARLRRSDATRCTIAGVPFPRDHRPAPRRFQAGSAHRASRIPGWRESRPPPSAAPSAP